MLSYKTRYVKYLDLHTGFKMEKAACNGALGEFTIDDLNSDIENGYIEIITSQEVE